MNIDELNQQIKSNDALLVYFSGEYCSVCNILKPKITKAFTQHYPKIKQIEIKTEQYLETTRQFNVFSLPTILVFFNGAEFQRKERNISVNGFILDVKRPYNMFFDE